LDTTQRIIEDWKIHLQSDLGGSQVKLRLGLKNLGRLSADICVIATPYITYEWYMKGATLIISLEGKAKSPYWGKALILALDKFLSYLEAKDLIRSVIHALHIERCKGLSKSLGKCVTKHHMVSKINKERRRSRHRP
jgi:hypothetical protein